MSTFSLYHNFGNTGSLVLRGQCGRVGPPGSTVRVARSLYCKNAGVSTGVLCDVKKVNAGFLPTAEVPETRAFLSEMQAIRATLTSCRTKIYIRRRRRGGGAARA